MSARIETVCIPSLGRYSVRRAVVAGCGDDFVVNRETVQLGTGKRRPLRSGHSSLFLRGSCSQVLEEVCGMG